MNFVITPQFREKHQAVTEVIESAARQDKRHWQQHDSLETLGGLTKANLLAIATRAESSDVEATLRFLRTPPLRAAKVVTKPEFLRLVCNVDPAASGRCG